MARLGTERNPLIVNVHHQKDAAKIMQICELKDWHVIIGLNKQDPEDISDLVQKLEPQTVNYEEPKIGRNDSCPCGSGKKYKKCCLQESQLL